MVRPDDEAILQKLKQVPLEIENRNGIYNALSLSLSHVQRLIWTVLESPMLPCWTLEISCLRAAIPPISGRVLILQQTQYYPLRCWIKAVNLLLVSQRWITWVEDPWLHCILTRILCFTPLISQWIPQIHTSDRIEQESGFNTPSKSCLKESSSEPLVSEFPLQSAKKILESPKLAVDPSEPSSV